MVFIESFYNIFIFLNAIFAIVIVFHERKQPAVTWAWLMVVLIIPYVGFFFYLLMGLDSRKDRKFIGKLRLDNQLFKEFTKNNLMGLENNSLELVENDSKLSSFKDIIFLNHYAGNGALTENNRITLFHEGNTKFDALLKDIKSAKHFIFLQYYIVRYDSLGLKIMDALTQKSREGVEVRFLIDGIGCFFTSKKIYQSLTVNNGKLAVFFSPYFFRINFRNHRKLAIIDGKIGLIGGLNIGNEYLGLKKRFGFWRDSHMRVEGDCVKEMLLRYIMDWNFCSKDKIELNKNYFPTLKPAKKIPMQIVSSGPDTKWPIIHYAYEKMITSAKKSIFIQTPYFVPDDSIFESLRIAALSGIDVRIMIPAKPDHLFVYWASLSYLGQLLDAGVKCYKYENGFLHSKILIIDSCLSSLGTANMDMRSFRLNFETNAFIYDSTTALQLEEQFYLDINDSTQIDLNWYQHRSFFTKIRESISRLISPML